MSGFAGHKPGERAYRRLIVGLFFAGVATFAQLYSPQAALPFLAADFGVSPATAALSVSGATIGIAVTVIPWSIAADRFGRLPAMSVGILVATAAGLAAPLLPGIEAFLIVRVIEGMALGAVPSVALAYLTEEVDAAHTARAAASYIAGTTIGGLSGRLVAGPFAEFGMWRAGLFVAAALCAVSAVVFLRLAPRARRFVPRREPVRAVGRRLLANLRLPAQRALYAQGFLLMGGFVAVYNYLGFLLAAPPYALPLWLVSLLFLAYLAGTFSSPQVGAFAARRGRLPALLLSVGIMMLGLVLMLVPALVAILIGLVVFTGGFFGAHAVASGWTPASAAPGAPAQASSLYYLAYYGGVERLRLGPRHRVRRIRMAGDGAVRRRHVRTGRPDRGGRPAPPPRALTSPGRWTPRPVARLGEPASVAQWKSSSVLRKRLGVRVPPGARYFYPLIRYSPYVMSNRAQARALRGPPCAGEAGWLAITARYGSAGAWKPGSGSLLLWTSSETDGPRSASEHPASS